MCLYVNLKQQNHSLVIAFKKFSLSNLDQFLPLLAAHNLVYLCPTTKRISALAVLKEQYSYIPLCKFETRNHFLSVIIMFKKFSLSNEGQFDPVSCSTVALIITPSIPALSTQAEGINKCQRHQAILSFKITYTCICKSKFDIPGNGQEQSYASLALRHTFRFTTFRFIWNLRLRKKEMRLLIFFSEMPEQCLFFNFFFFITEVRMRKKRQITPN